jgi:O-antigen/teichoic acid export membrane protein
MSLKTNLIFNYIGQAWVGLMGLAFIPIYVKYLGIEAYALVGIFIAFQAWLQLLDMGMSAAISREMARFSADEQSSSRGLSDLLRTVEVINLVLASIVAIGFMLSSAWIATSWLKASNVCVSAIEQSLCLMGIGLAARLMEGIYKSALLGLQRQVLLNSINMFFATFKWGGSAAVLVFTKADVLHFFAWHAFAAIVSAAVLGLGTYKKLPRSDHKARFSTDAIYGIWKFAGGVFCITLLGLLLTQIDKVLLSKLISLSEFGYFSLASTVSGSLTLLIYPVTQAYYPKFCEFVVRMEESKLIDSFHQSSQIITTVVGSLSWVLIFFSETILAIWISDADVVLNSASILRLIALGNLLNSFLWIPHQAQLAHAWTSLSVKVNVIAVCIMIPAILLFVPQYGALAAARLWCTLNVLFIFIAIPMMFRKIMASAMKQWYLSDIFIPLMSSLFVIIFAKFFFINEAGEIFKLGYLALAAFLALLASVASSSHLRPWMCNFIRSNSNHLEVDR